MKTAIVRRGAWRWLVPLAAFGLAGASALAVDPIPDYKFLVHPAVPKDGTGPAAGAMAPATIRNTFETVVETYWKEISYHEADPTTGFSLRGFYPDTKTYGYTWLPWACNNSAGGRPDGYANAFLEAVLPKLNRPVTFGGEHNYESGAPVGVPNQLYGGTGPLVDGYWTPGERFQDVNGNGRWDPPGAVTLGEDWWNTDNTYVVVPEAVWPGPQEVFGYNGAAGGGPDNRGELYADYNRNTITGLVGGVVRVTTLGFNPSVLIYLANGESNAPITLSEFDLTPNNNLIATNQPSAEGDFNHTRILAPSGAAAGSGNIPRNGVFNYQLNPVTARPNVYPAVSTIDGTPLTVTYQRWMTSSNTVYTGTKASLDGAVLRDVVVPIYQATELYGAPLSGGRYVDDNGVWAPGAIGTPAEPFEDFLSWWVPFAGADQQGRWVSGIAGAPMAIQQPNADADWGVILAYSSYVDYIANNYPGDTAALIARTGNGVYDGPDNWVDLISNKMRIRGVVPAVGSAPQPLTAPPSTYWDPHGWYPGGWSAWWTSVFGTAVPPTVGSPFCGSWWPGNGIPRCEQCTPAAVTIAPGAWVPPLQNSWRYDAPREFQDLPSSIYHLGNFDGRGAYAGNPYPGGGDLRLGEVTSPWDEQIYGADLGNGNPWIGTPFSSGDGNIPCGGPLAYNGLATATFDANNVLSLEAATWRTDGQALTGPRSPAVSRGSGATPILYGGDHRDVNLDGLIDQGETVPAGSHAYFIDDRPGETSPDGGFTSKDLSPFSCKDLYPFNWDRYAEDVIQANDYVEDYAGVARYNTVTSDEIIRSNEHLKPLDPGTPVLAVVGRANTFPHTVFRPGDGVWIDANGDGRYNADVALNAIGAGATITNGTVGAALTPVRLRDVNANGLDRASDDLWVDNGATAGKFDSERVLADAGLLRNGVVGKSIAWANPTVVLRYRDRDSSGTFTAPDDVWLEGAPGATNAVPNVYDASDTLILSWSGVAYGVTGSGVVPNAVYVNRKPAGTVDNGFVLGDEMWIDANANLRFDCEEIVYRANRFIYAWNDRRALTNGAAGAALSGIVTRELNAVAGYQQSGDEAWQDNTGNTTFGQELAIVATGLNNGVTKSYDIPTAVYFDYDGNLAYNAEVDPLWQENNGDGQYAAARNFNIPIYFVGMHAGIGIGVDLAGNTFNVFHRDGQAPLGGFIQVVPAMSLGLLTHEQAHDTQGWPDLYDYDVFDANAFVNYPIGAFDLMANGGLVHGVPDLKVARGWTRATDLQTIFPMNSGVHTLFMWPVERHGDQYFYFNNPSNPGERLWFWYQSGQTANPYQNFSGVGGRGVHIEHVDYAGHTPALPAQQRINSHFAYQMVQADGLYEMEDGINQGTPADVFPGTTGNTLLTPDTIPATRWWDTSDAGIRVVDIRLPADPDGPVQVDFEIYDTGVPFLWPVNGTDSDGDGIADVWEMYHFGSLTIANRNSDYDGDGLKDRGEFLARTNPKSVGASLDASGDTDGDGLSNSQEVGAYGTLPYVADTDGDGLFDGAEVAMGLNPLSADDDNDGIDTWRETHWDGSGAYNPRSASNPAGTDLNAGVVDTDGDGVSDLMELAAGSNPLNPADARVLVVSGLEATVGGAAVSWDVPVNKGHIPLIYRLERSDDLKNWVEVDAVHAPGTSQRKATVQSAPAAGGYYRVTAEAVATATP